MFRMLSCFNLKPGVAVQEFQHALSRLSDHMEENGLIESTGPVGERQNDTPMDTDAERDHRYFFIMTFRDRAQCDRAYAYIKPHDELGESVHHSVYSKVENPVFICWQDL